MNGEREDRSIGTMAVGTCRLAAGPFLPASPNWVEQHVKSPSGFLLDRYPGGVRMDRAGLGTAWVYGDSMIYRGIYAEFRS